MGTLRKRGMGWYAEVCIRRQRKGKTCRTKAAAEAWIKEIERKGTIAMHTVGEAFDRYRRSYTARKASRRREEQRLDRLCSRLGARTPLSELSADRLAH